MKKRIATIIWWTLIFYFIFSPLRDFASGNLEDFYRIFTTARGFLLFSSTFFAFLFYTLATYLILFYTYQKRKRVLGVALFLVMIPVAIAFRYVLQEVIFEVLFGFTNYLRNPTWHYYFFDNLYYAFLFSCFGAAVFFVRYTRYKEQQRAQYEIENQRSQLSMLRSQMNPHFIFNTLNGIYALVHSKSEKALPAIETLSSLLRYSLYQKEERVNLHKEWQFIEDYISLQNTRLSEPAQILLDVPAELPALSVLPFSLIPFVENAFKHGALHQAKTPIRIGMRTDETHFFFHVKNKIKPQHKDDTGGIGLINTSKRLQLFYEEKHLLKVEENEGTFLVELRIPLVLC